MIVTVDSLRRPDNEIRFGYITGFTLYVSNKLKGMDKRKRRRLNRKFRRIA